MNRAHSPPCIHSARSKYIHKPSSNSATHSCAGMKSVCWCSGLALTCMLLLSAQHCHCIHYSNSSSHHSKKDNYNRCYNHSDFHWRVSRQVSGGAVEAKRQISDCHLKCPYTTAHKWREQQSYIVHIYNSGDSTVPSGRHSGLLCELLGLLYTHTHTQLEVHPFQTYIGMSTLMHVIIFKHSGLRVHIHFVALDLEHLTTWGSS